MSFGHIESVQCFPKGRQTAMYHSDHLPLHRITIIKRVMFSEL